MAEVMTIARPYANAIFKLARDKGELAGWSELLAVLAQSVQSADVSAVLTNPAVSNDNAVALLADIAGKAMTDDGKNMLHVLAENDRLLVLDDIAVLYEDLRAEEEGTLSAEVVSAKKLTAPQQKKLAAALKARLNRDVILDCSVDETLLGGAIVRAGDLVIDGSALGKLNKLANVLN